MSFKDEGEKFIIKNTLEDSELPLNKEMYGVFHYFINSQSLPF